MHRSEEFIFHKGATDSGRWMYQTQGRDGTIEGIPYLTFEAVDEEGGQRLSRLMTLGT